MNKKEVIKKEVICKQKRKIGKKKYIVIST
jgi:hypothetical protein